jgi:hypothetical protein
VQAKQSKKYTTEGISNFLIDLAGPPLIVKVLL